MTKREIDKSTQIERLHVEELDKILGWKFPVLDHGFVRVVDYMGDDTSIVQAARVSYGNGTTSVNEDTGLIRYLMRHKHETPTEMCNIKFHIKLPIFVMRQLVRHRMCCLSKDTLLWTVRPDTLGLRAITIEDFYNNWHSCKTQRQGNFKLDTHVDRIDPDKMYSVPELSAIVERSQYTLRTYISSGLINATKYDYINNRFPDGTSIRVKGSDYIKWASNRKTRPINNMKDRLKQVYIRSLDEDNFVFFHNHITDVIKSGVKDVYRVITSDGKSITTTLDHKYYTDKGWKRLYEIYDVETNYSNARVCVNVCKSQIASFEGTSFVPEYDYDNEKWKPLYVDSLDHRYEISNYGRILDLDRDIILKPTIYNGYCVVSLNVITEWKTYQTHRLTAMVFKNNRYDKPYVRHVDGNRQNNHISNLEWSTASENSNDKIYHGTMTYNSPDFVDVVSVEYVGQEMTYDLEVKGPNHNFLANGFVVHNSINEYSARYSVLDNEFYIPELKDLAKQSSSNNQGRGELLSEDYAKGAQSLLYNDSQQCYSSYLLLLNDYELARELARMNLTINSYTQIYWSLNLRSLFNFIKLRIDSHAQYEIRVYAQEIYNIVKKWVPISSKAFEDYTLNSVTLSDGAFNIIKDIINRNFVDFKNYNLSKREINELKKQFNIEEYIKKENKSLQFYTLK